MKYFVIIAILLGALGWLISTNIAKSPKPILEQPRVSPSIVDLGPNVEILHEAPLTSHTLLFKTSGQGKLLQLNDTRYFELDLVSVPPIPDLFIYLAKQKMPFSSNKLGEYVSIGQLRKNEGTQLYLLPDNEEEYSTFVIWSRAFDIPIASWSRE